MAVVLFEDVHAAQLGPITNLRPTYSITCGGNRLVDLAAIVGQPVFGLPRPYLKALQLARYPEIAEGMPPADQPHLFINARLVPSPTAMTQLQRGSAAANEWAIVENGQLLAGKFQARQPLSELATSASLDEWVGSDVPRIENAGNVLAMFHYPHEVITYHQRIVSAGIELYAQRREIPQVTDGVFVAEQQSFAPNVSTSAKEGPIVVAEGAKLGPGSVLVGPVLVGPNVIVREHASIKGGTVLGHSCRVGGEIDGSIFEPYTNKQHYGFIGHSYVGSWVNLGAGTTNSDLKNTYGNVQLTYRNEKVDTGERLLGCILGDFVKTAINTSIFTGKFVGSFSNLYGFITENVGPFMNYAKSLGSVSAMNPEVVLKMQERMFARRGVGQLECDKLLIQQLFEATTATRARLETKPPSF